MGHLESKIRSPDQKIDNPCQCSEGQIFACILFKAACAQFVKLYKLKY